MADEPGTATPEPEVEAKEEDDKTFTQAELDRIVSDRLGRERARYEGYDELKAKAEQFDALSEKDKTESEKLAGKLTKAEERATAAENGLLRFRVAAEKKLPAELIDRMHGSTEEELAVDADKLLDLVKTPERTPEFDGGPREPAGEPKTAAQEHNDLAVALFGQPRPQP